jgi:hypothetical protein
MEITHLFKAKEPVTPPELFLAIQIQEGLVKTAIWQVSNGKPEIVSYGSQEEWGDTESLLVAVDTSLAHALESQDQEPNRVIFGLPESWIKEDKISPESSAYLKELIKKLELEPVGFVAITEAIIQQLKLSEGIPPTAIFLEVHSSKVNVVVTRLGDIVGREEVGRSQDLAKDVQEGLARLDLDHLPARILVINGQDPDIEQQLTSFPWQDHLPFPHLPKVEIPDPKLSIQAIALSGGSEAARSLGISVTETKKTQNHPTTSNSSSNSSVPPPSVLTNHGFVTGRDIRDTNTPSYPSVSPSSPTSQANFTNSSPSIPNHPPVSPPSLLSRVTSPIKQFLELSRSQTYIKKPPYLNLKHSKLILIIPPLLVISLILSAVLVHGFFSSATLVLHISPKQIDKSFSLAVSDSPHPDLPTVPATLDSLELEASGSLPTTGEATVGDKAVGEVTVFNKTDTEKTLEKGTTIITADNLKFTLDQDLNIASRSAEEQEGGVNIIYGKSSVAVTAANIGAEYNISTDTDFTVGTFPKSSLEAKATKDFSGGTSRTVKAVSANDQQALLDQLTQQIQQQAQDQLSSSTEYQVVPQDTQVISKQYSHDVGEEASTLSLDLKVKANFLKFLQSDLHSLIESEISSDIPPDFALDSSNTQISIDPTQSDPDTGYAITTATVKASLMPQLSVSDYQQQLKGKTLNAAKTLLQTIPGYQKTTVIINPNLPFITEKLPLNPAKINLTLEPSAQP